MPPTVIPSYRAHRFWGGSGQPGKGVVNVAERLTGKVDAESIGCRDCMYCIYCEICDLYEAVFGDGKAVGRHALFSY